SVLGGDDRHHYAASATYSWARRALGHILFEEPDPRVSVVCFRVRARGVEHALDRVCSASDIAATFDGRERGSDQHQQEADNAKDDEQFQKRKGGRSAAVFSSGRSSDRRSRREQSVAGKPSRQYRTLRGPQPKIVGPRDPYLSYGRNSNRLVEDCQ